MDEKKLGEKNQYGYTVYTGNTGKTASEKDEWNTISSTTTTPRTKKSDIERFNWGAFFLTWVWSLFNCKPTITAIYIALSVFLPLFGPMIAILVDLCARIWLGLRGNQPAWENKRWKSVEYFHEVQRKWVQGFFIYLSVIMILMMLAVGYLKNNPEQLEKLKEYNNKNAYTTSQPLPSQSMSSPSNSLLPEMGMVRYSIKNIPENVVNYLKTSNKYSRFNDGKKLVISFSVPNCPYARATKSVVDQAKNIDYYTSAYNFYQLSGNRTENYRDMSEAKAANKLYDLCGQFCIINLSNNQIFSFPVLRTEQVNKVGYVLQQLHDW